MLNLESNQLNSENGSEPWGLYDFVDFLDHNTTLLSLNLANNQIDETTGGKFREKIENNDTLIDFDFSMNHFSMADSQAIQDKLVANKAAYDEERRREWKERQAMKAEDQALRKHFLSEASATESRRMEEEAREIREAELNAKWHKKMLETEIEKQQLI